MNLRLAGHILRKDTRRLWWVIALTVALLGRLVHFDSLRDFAVPGTEEGWLNVLLPLAWSLLIALAVLEDPPVGEAPFWATVPCRWQSLAAAKAAFIALFIHVPYFIACAVTMQARGFAPAEFTGDLFYKQFELLALTLGSLALATVVRNVTQFMTIAIVAATALGAPAIDYDSAVVRHLRETLACLAILAAAAWIAASQYRSRRTAISRAVGISALVGVATIWWLPRESFYGLQAALSPAHGGQIGVRVTQPSGATRQLPYRMGSATIGIPVAVSGLAQNEHARFMQTGLTLQDVSGRSYEANAHRSTGQSGPLLASLCCSIDSPTRQILTVDSGLMNRIGNEPMSLDGTVLAEYYRIPEPTVSSVGATVLVAGLGRCSSDMRIGADPMNEMLHVDCESPHLLPHIDVTLTDLPTGRQWHESLGSGYTFLNSSNPRRTWLSPVNRLDTFFQSTDEKLYAMPNGSKFAVPREVIQSVQVAITPEFPDGVRIVRYELSGIRLEQYRVKP